MRFRLPQGLFTQWRASNLECAISSITSISWFPSTATTTAHDDDDDADDDDFDFDDDCNHRTVWGPRAGNIF